MATAVESLGKMKCCLLRYLGGKHGLCFSTNIAATHPTLRTLLHFIQLEVKKN
jgi:hypothetical protein